MLVPSIFSNNFVDDIFDDVFPFGAYNAPAADNRAAMNTDVKEFDDRYELEFEANGNEYEYDVNAVTGKVMKAEHDIAGQNDDLSLIHI